MCGSDFWLTYSLENREINQLFKHIRPTNFCAGRIFSRIVFAIVFVVDCDVFNELRTFLMERQCNNIRN